MNKLLVGHSYYLHACRNGHRFPLPCVIEIIPLSAYDISCGYNNGTSPLHYKAKHIHSFPNTSRDNMLGHSISETWWITIDEVRAYVIENKRLRNKAIKLLGVRQG